MPHVAGPEQCASSPTTGTAEPEDTVAGALSWIPKVNFYNPFLVCGNGNKFISFLETGDLNEHNKSEAYWAGRYE